MKERKKKKRKKEVRRKTEKYRANEKSGGKGEAEKRKWPPTSFTMDQSNLIRPHY